MTRTQPQLKGGIDGYGLGEGRGSRQDPIGLWVGVYQEKFYKDGETFDLYIETGVTMSVKLTCHTCQHTQNGHPIFRKYHQPYYKFNVQANFR